jgi:hypothetical protein
LRANGLDAAVFRRRAQEGGVALGAPRDGWFTVSVNETWNRAEPREILGRLQKALG